MFNIESRRYIGSKKKLLNEIMEHIPSDSIVVDIFGGTGVVTKEISKKSRVIVNDMLFSNFLVYDAFFGGKEISLKILAKFEKQFNSIEPIKENYVSKNFGDKYFEMRVARKIGAIREEIEKNVKNKEIKNILIVSLLYSMDRYANTVGHYEMYLKNTKKLKNNFIFKLINTSSRGAKITYFNEDANKLIKKVSGDILYLDPPYNARQYINFYHIWENIAKWEKPPLSWESLKFDRNNLKSKYSTSKAKDAMKLLINNSKGKFKKIIVSYNNTYNANSVASNNKIKFEEMINLLKDFGDVTVKEINYKHFNAGKTNFNNHKEYIFVAESQ